MHRDGDKVRDLSDRQKHLLGVELDCEEINAQDMDISGAFKKVRQQISEFQEMYANAEFGHLSVQQCGQIALLSAQAQIDYSIVEAMAGEVSDVWLNK